MHFRNEDLIASHHFTKTPIFGPKGFLMSASIETPLPGSIAATKETKHGEILCQQITKVLEEGPCAIEKRIAELEREWTAGRLVKASTGVSILLGLVLAAYVSPWFLILPALSALVLLQYLFFARSWFAEIFISFGYRSGAQIEDERIAMRILRGDFKKLPTLAHIEDREALSRLEGEGGPAIEHDCDKFDVREAAEVILQSTKDIHH